MASRVVIDTDENGNKKAFGSMKSLCDWHGWSYLYLVRKKPPFDYKNHTIERLSITRANSGS